MGITTKDLAALGDVVADTLNAKLKPLRERVDALETRQDVIENKTAPVAWQGVFASGKRYRPGNLVTKSGSLWIAIGETVATPGNDPNWKLVCKAGAAKAAIEALEARIAALEAKQ